MLLFVFLKFVFGIVKRINSFLLKVRKSKDERLTADVYSVWGRQRLSPFDFSVDELISFYRTSVHPSTVMEDDCTLFKLTKERAYFVRCNVDVFDLTGDAFAYNAQFNSARELISLPIDSFHRIGKQVELPRIPIVHGANHGRCGSTLIANMFAAVPKALAISEVMAFTDLAEMARSGELDDQELSRMCYSSVMCLVKHAVSREASVMFFKHQSMALFITDAMHKMIPSIINVYMYRQPVSYVRSLQKLVFMNKLPPATFTAMIPFIAQLGDHAVMKPYPCYTQDQLEVMDEFTQKSLVWITSTAAYLRFAKQMPLKTIKYEDIQARSKEVIKALFEHVRIPQSMFPDFDKVLGRDSQEGSVFSSRHLTEEDIKSACPEITAVVKDEVDRCCGQFTVPHFWSGDVVLPNSLME